MALRDTWSDRWQRFARRNRALMRSAAAALLVVAVVATVATLLVDRQRRQNASREPAHRRAAGVTISFRPPVG